jgi:hypothetical protein
MRARRARPVGTRREGNGSGTGEDDGADVVAFGRLTERVVEPVAGVAVDRVALLRTVDAHGPDTVRVVDAHAHGAAGTTIVGDVTARELLGEEMETGPAP